MVLSASTKKAIDVLFDRFDGFSCFCAPLASKNARNSTFPNGPGQLAKPPARAAQLDQLTPQLGQPASQVEVYIVFSTTQNGPPKNCQKVGK